MVCLFVTLLIAYAIYRMKLLRNIWSTLAVIVVLAVIGTVAIPRIPVPYFGRLPFKIDSAITAAVFLLLGYVVKQKKDLIRWNLWVRSAGLIVLPVLVYFVSVRWNGYVNICDFEYSNPILYFIAAIAGSVWLIDIGSFLEKSKILCWIGKNSLYLFGIHSFVLWAWIRVYCKIMHVETEYLTNVGWILAVSLVTLASCMAVIAVYLKLASVIKAKYRMGKQ